MRTFVRFPSVCQEIKFIFLLRSFKIITVIEVEKYNRLKDVFSYYKTQGYSQKSFAEKIGLSDSQFNSILQNKSKLREIHLIALKYIFKIDPHWLETGEGEMIYDTWTDELDKRAKKIFKAYAKLNEQKRETLALMADSLLEQQRREDHLKVSEKNQKFGA